ncbi:MAG: SCP2 sterol-binding domain-containing protein [Clostridiales bacterium]|nr:SCP2 sterol-binding domain-containing protein [Clostridiales bacterium]
MTYAEVFSEIKAELMNADVSGIQEHLAYQFNITGEPSGIFYVEVKEGKLYVEPYEYYDRDAMFTCSAEVLKKLAAGKLNPILAFTTQRLKVEGDFGKAARLKELIESYAGPSEESGESEAEQ